MTDPTPPTAANAVGPRFFDRWLMRTALVTGGAVLAALTLLCVFNVLVMRKLLAAPIAGAEDVLILLLVTFVALSIPFGARTGAHIEIEVVSDLLPAGVSRGLQVAARCASAVFLGLMSWQLVEAGPPIRPFWRSDPAARNLVSALLLSARAVFRDLYYFAGC